MNLFDELQKLEEKLLWCSWFEVTARNFLWNLDMASEWNDIMVRLELRHEELTAKLDRKMQPIYQEIVASIREKEANK